MTSSLPTKDVPPEGDPTSGGELTFASARVTAVKSTVASRSVLHEAYAEAPLALSCPKNHGHAAWVFPTVLGPGMLNGDRQRYGLHVREGAALYVGSIGIARAFRGEARLETRATVDDDALLVMAQEPLTGAAGADLSQDTRVALAPRGSVVLVDALTEGRPETGEKWRFSRLRSRLVVSRGATTLLEEAQDLQPALRDVARHFGRYGAFAFLVATGPRALPFREAWLAAKPSGNGPVMRVASPLGADGATLRIAAESAEGLAAELRIHLRDLGAALGDDPRSRRIS